MYSGERSVPLGALVWSGRSEKQDGRPCLSLAEIFSTSPLKPAERNSTKLDMNQDLNVFYLVCVFCVDRKKKMAALSTDWLRHFWLLHWNRRTEFNENAQEVRSQHPLPSVCFSGRSKKTRWPPWPLIGWDIFYFSSETTERNSTKLNRKQDLNAPTKFVFFRANRKNKMAAIASDWLIHFDFAETADLNSTKCGKKQDVNVLYQVCVLGRLLKQDGRLGLWLAETFSTSLKALNGIKWNCTGS